MCRAPEAQKIDFHFYAPELLCAGTSGAKGKKNLKKFFSNFFFFKKKNFFFPVFFSNASFFKKKQLRFSNKKLLL